MYLRLLQEFVVSRTSSQLTQERKGCCFLSSLSSCFRRTVRIDVISLLTISARPKRMCVLMCSYVTLKKYYNSTSSSEFAVEWPRWYFFSFAMSILGIWCPRVHGTCIIHAINRRSYRCIMHGHGENRFRCHSNALSTDSHESSLTYFLTLKGWRGLVCAWSP